MSDELVCSFCHVTPRDQVWQPELYLPSQLSDLYLFLFFYFFEAWPHVVPLQVLVPLPPKC